jgi:hypothetical protein
MSDRALRAGRLVFAAGVIATLSFGVAQATASQRARDPCDCDRTNPDPTQCDACCGLPGGFCTTINYCICN